MKEWLYDIAAEVGLPRPAMHYYFRTKERLFQAVFGDILMSFLPKVSDLTQVLIAVSMPPRIARGFSSRASAKANVSICSQPEPNGTITLSILVLSKLDKV